MIDIALFGLGRIGIMHGKNLMRSKDFNLKYIYDICLLYTSPSPRDMRRSRMPSSA